MTVKARPSVYQIAAYKPGDAGRSFQGRRIRLASNETSLGPSPKAIAAYKDYQDLHRYPDDTCQVLRQALADKYKINADKIACGAGSSELIRRLIQTYAGEGDEVLFPQHGFLMYGIYAHGAGAIPVKAPENNFTTDPDALIAAVTNKTKVVLVANPNNPTGTEISFQEVKKLHERLPASVLFVLDLAYVEYLPDHDEKAYFEWVNGHKNIVLTRTFSKIYGLAGLRVGWAYADVDVIEAIWRTHDPFHVSMPAQLAAAAALNDNAFLEATKASTASARAHLFSHLDKLGLLYLTSRVNFVCVKFGPEADSINQKLISKGIFVRPIAGYGLPEYLRITIGTQEEISILAATLKDIL